MTRPRLAACVAAVFIVMAVVAGGLHALLPADLTEIPGFTRGEEDERLGAYFASRVIFVLLFTRFFLAASRRRDVASGLVHGMLAWLFYSVPMTVGFWAFMPMPDAVAGGWLGIGLAECLAGGAVLGLLARGHDAPGAS